MVYTHCIPRTSLRLSLWNDVHTRFDSPTKSHARVRRAPSLVVIDTWVDGGSVFVMILRIDRQVAILFLLWYHLVDYDLSISLPAKSRCTLTWSGS